MAKKNGAPEADEPKPIAEPGAPVEDIDLGDRQAESELTEEQQDLVEEVEREAVETPALSAKEVEEIRKAARRDVEAEVKQKLKAQLREAEKRKLRERMSVSDNEHLSGPLSDLVRITINIPEFSNCPWIQLNMPDGPRYWHGVTYPVKRHIGNQLRETMQAMRRHQNEIDGKKRNRQLPDGSFVDVVTGARSGHRKPDGTFVGGKQVGAAA